MIEELIKEHGEPRWAARVYGQLFDAASLEQFWEQIEEFERGHNGRLSSIVPSYYWNV